MLGPVVLSAHALPSRARLKITPSPHMRRTMRTPRIGPLDGTQMIVNHQRSGVAEQQGAI